LPTSSARTSGHSHGRDESVAVCIQDGSSERSFASESPEVTAADVVPVPMRARGDFAMRFAKRP
jgi:hypothetical protein